MLSRRTKESCCFIIALTFLLGLVSVAQAKKEPKPVISRITVRSTDIFDFDTKPYLKKFPYTAINFIHIKTQQQIIDQEILFKEGDPVDDFLLQETERNLRALPFIRSARIAKFPQRDGTMVIVVYVNDSWTTEPQINLNGINRIDDLEFGFKEKNFLGYGKSLEFKYNTDSDAEFEQRTYRYNDLRVFNSRWQFKTEVIDRTGGEEENYVLQRPFFSADTMWAFRSSYKHEDQILEQFNTSNVKVSEVDQLKEVSEFSAATKIGGGRRIVNRIGPRYLRELARFSRNDKTATGVAVPQNQNFQTVFLDYELIRNKFIKMTRLERMTRIEDINLGPTFSVAPGVQPKVLTGTKDSSSLQAAYQQSFLVRGEHLWQNKFRTSSRRTFEARTNEKYEIDTKYYHRHSANQTFVFHSRVEWGEKLDLDNQITLGGNNGLRSFKVDSIVGSKSFLVNLEDRIFFSDEVLNLFALGGVAFLDAGYVWQRGSPVSFSELRSDVGVGFRLGLTRSSNEVILRFDVAYRMQRLNSDDPRWVVSFGSGQAF